MLFRNTQKNSSKEPEKHPEYQNLRKQNIAKKYSENLEKQTEPKFHYFNCTKKSKKVDSEKRIIKKGVNFFLILQNKISVYMFIVHTLWLRYIYTSLYSVHNLTHSEVENCTKTQ